VKGSAVPSRMRLQYSQQRTAYAYAHVPLNKLHAALLTIDEVASQRIHDHEHKLVKWCFRGLQVSFAPPSLRHPGHIFVLCQSRHKRLVREEASCKDQDCDWNQ
jgi:hypothetical protein